MEADSSSTLVRIGISSSETMLFTVAGAATMADFLFTGTPQQAIAGSSGNDDLVGGSAVRMVGGAGNDVYHVSHGAEQVLDYGGEGFDTVYTSVSFALSAIEEVEALFAADSASTTAINLTGNYVGNVISGNAGANIIDGGTGNDTLTGGGGADQLIGGGQSDVFVYNAVTDSLAGQEDWLSDFEHGTDKIDMRSLTVDTIFFNVAADNSATRVTLGTASGSLVINVAGVARSADFLFNGAPPADNSVYGTSGPDTLDAGGRSGISLIGLAGNDIYRVFDGSEIIVEQAGEGSDVVYAGTSYALTAGSHVELLLPTDVSLTSALNLTGNELANTITGNAGVNILSGGDGNDVLDGRGGADTLVGGAGNDVLYVDAAGDVVQEMAGGGSDTVYTTASYVLALGAEVEVLSVYDRTATTAINLTGSNTANTIYGNAGNNLIDGRGGNDALRGLAGNDTFAFSTALGESNVDTILDYSVADDTIQLDNTIFGGLAAGALAAGAFNTGAAASELDDRIIYNSATGALLFDPDGTGGGTAIQFAITSPGIALTASEFVVV